MPSKDKFVLAYLLRSIDEIFIPENWIFRRVESVA